MIFRATSTNIRFESPNDGANGWAFRKDSLASVLNSFDPHLIGTQEGRRPQLRELASRLPGYLLVEEHRQWHADRMYPCLFVKRNALEVIDSGDIWLSNTPGIPGSVSPQSDFPRLCVWAYLKAKESGKYFFAVNTHLDHLNAEVRKFQITILADEFLKINRSHKPLTMMGDFNEGPGEQVDAILQTKFPGIVDPWIQLGLKEETSHHKFKGILPGGKRIDRFMVSGEFSATSMSFDKTRNGERFPSDHFPLNAVFNF